MAWKTHIIHQTLLRFGPSENALLDWLRPHIDASMLREIAAADYGDGDQENLPVLTQIRDGREIPAPLPWHPREVLNLTRWSEPDDLWGCGSSGERGHLIRAFCCAVLLKAADDPQTQDYIIDESDTLAQGIASVLTLGCEACEAALRFLSWRILRLTTENDEYPFFALGLLLLRAALFEPGQDGADLKMLADWVVREETRARRMPMALETENWLLTEFGLRNEVWQRLAQEFLRDPAKGYPEPAASVLREIARRLLPGPPPTIKDIFHLPGPVNGQ